jgi:hypothetical protein
MVGSGMVGGGLGVFVGSGGLGVCVGLGGGGGSGVSVAFGGGGGSGVLVGGGGGGGSGVFVGGGGGGSGVSVGGGGGGGSGVSVGGGGASVGAIVGKGSFCAMAIGNADGRTGTRVANVIRITKNVRERILAMDTAFAGAVTGQAGLSGVGFADTGDRRCGLLPEVFRPTV